ncbi:family 78 glycoside hydrolase catalytic domain [Cohnella sp. GCM10027633]|uniref:family 78 glycoside hydrolase catalytic domain n=1 Tax=unclassified Cohnella TaxID=2636738 RepID=UPI0036359D59
MESRWTAEWIWAEGTLGHHDVFVEARKTFEVPAGTDRACIRISANQSYKLFLNGDELGRGPAPSDLDWISYDTYEVIDHLRDGLNVIAIVANNFGHAEIVTMQAQGPGGLICQVDLYAEGSSGIEPIGTIASGTDWRCRRSACWKQGTSRLHLWGGYREIYDVNYEDGWLTEDYDDSAWPAAVGVGKIGQSPWPRLLPREIPFLSKTIVHPIGYVAAEAYLGAVYSPEAVVADRGSSESFVMDASVPGSLPQVTYDFGAEIVGYSRLEVSAPEGGVVQLYYGESLEMALMDTFLLRPGDNVLAPFGRRAFRYMKVAAMATPVPITVKELKVEFVHYPYSAEGRFLCSDELLNRIWETGRYTTIVNSQNHFEDCPYREAALWVADAVVMSKVVYHISDDPAIIRKSLLQLARIQNPDGSIPGAGPQRSAFLLPDFCAHWLFGVWDYYAYSGDLKFLEEIWPNVLRLIDWFENQENRDGLFAGADREGWWCFIDWSDDIERKDRVTAISCFYYKFLLTAASIAGLLGEQEREEKLGMKAKALRLSIRSLLRVPGTNVYSDCLSGEGLSPSITAQTNFVAAWSGIMERSEAASFIEDYYSANKLPRIKGAFFYHIVLETLFRYRYTEEAMKHIRGYWGAMLDRGATTWWETFDPSLPFPTTPSAYLGHTPTYLMDSIPVSLSHGWGASPTYLLSRELLGVNMSSAETTGVILQPNAVNGVDWAEGIVPTKYGNLYAEWRRGEDGVLQFQAKLPSQLSWEARGLEDVTSVHEETGFVRVTARITSTVARSQELLTANE